MILRSIWGQQDGSAGNGTFAAKPDLSFIPRTLVEKGKSLTPSTCSMASIFMPWYMHVPFSGWMVRLEIIRWYCICLVCMKSWVWFPTPQWFIPVIPALGRWSQEDQNSSCTSCIVTSRPARAVWDHFWKLQCANIYVWCTGLDFFPQRFFFKVLITK